MGIVDDNGYEDVRGLDYGVGNEHGMGRIWPCKGGSDEQANPPFPVHHISKHGLATTPLAAHVSCRVYEAVLFAERGPPHSSLNSTPGSLLKCHLASTYQNNKMR
ncbi:hypothetical protein VitviT2T_020454 [Vitis vinifera]|uniref:Uncharacterized protein n=1 Tax=Vitis vinifera TaxID=29760 RepID=A0ABY9D416_VITVI|nr:hypothetical protein VitviT2T_020454 [Vitis vinifera]